MNSLIRFDSLAARYVKGMLAFDTQIGPDLVINGAFAADTDWTTPAGWSIAAGVANHGSNGTGALEPSTALSVVVNGIYKITYDVTYTSGTGVTPQIGGTSGATRAVTKTGYVDYLKAATTGNLKFTTANADRISIDNVTCQLVAIAAADRVTIWTEDQGGTAGKASLFAMSEDGTLVVIGGPNGIELWPGDTIPGLRLFNAKNPLEYLNIVADTNVFQIFSAAASGGTGRSLTLGNNRGSDYVTLDADGSMALISKNNKDITLTPNGSGKVGIGITPTYALDISRPGTGMRITNTDLNAYQGIILGNGSQVYIVQSYGSYGAFVTGGVTGEALHIDKQGNFPIELSTNDAPRLNITGAGAIGMGITAPRARLDLATGFLVGTGLQLPHVVAKAASANVRNSHDAEATDTSGTYVKKKTITLTNGLVGAARFLFDLKTGTPPTAAYGRIYRNGVALGTEQSDVTGGYVTKSEDLTQTWNPGDTAELWVHGDGVLTVSVQNFRIAYDDSPTVAVASANS